MKSRDIVIGFIFLIILIAGVLWIFKAKKNNIVNSPAVTPNITSKINTAFPNLTIPDGVERANLTNVSGGEGVGVATRTEIVVNLPSGQVYQGWLENSEGNKILLGTFRVSKSGWLLTYNSTKYPGYNKVVVTEADKTLLEGSF